MTYNGHTYYLIATTVESGKTAWNDARTYLQEKFSCDLAIINDADENQALFDFTREKTTEAYFGLSDANSEGEWIWIDGSALTYSNWDSDEPGGSESDNYAYFCFDDGTWNDGDVSYLGYVQENDVYFIGEKDNNSSSGSDSLCKIQLAQWSFEYKPSSQMEKFFGAV